MSKRVIKLHFLCLKVFKIESFPRVYLEHLGHIKVQYPVRKHGPLNWTWHFSFLSLLFRTSAENKMILSKS